MPYIKQLSPGRKEAFEIKELFISLEVKQVQAAIDHISYDTNQTPRVTRLNFSIENQNERIIDPAWNAASTPPKPPNFDEQNPDTWGDLSFDDFPRVIDPEKQYFSKLVLKTGSAGATIYERIKRVIYDMLIEIEFLPSGSGWQIE